MSDKNDRLHPPLSPISSVTSSVACAFLAGAAVGAASIFVRGRRVSLQRAMETTAVMSDRVAMNKATEGIHAALLGLRQEVNQTVSSAESRLSDRLQSQERAIGSKFDSVSAARSELMGVANNVEELRKIFLSPQRRGAFGELQLEGIIRDVMHPGSYAFQATLKNGTRPDCLIRMPPPIGNLAIDSKFPLDAFLELTKIPTLPGDEKGSGCDESQKEEMVRKKLSQHLLKHVHDVSKYIIPGETGDCALLFIPSEAIFAEIVENHQHVLTHANSKRVWIVCPTTLMPILTAMKGAVRGIEVTERSHAIVAEVAAILQDVNRLVARSQKLEKDINSARESLRQMGISFEKIKRRTIKLNVLNENDDQPLVMEPAKKKNESRENGIVNGSVENDARVEEHKLSPKSK